MSEPSGAASPVAWTQFTQDPRRPDSAPLRASDRDRDVVLTVLGESYAEGRLTREEHDERSDRTIASRTLGELVPLVVDLVPASVPRARQAGSQDLAARAQQHWWAEVRKALVTFLLPTLICWAVYVLTGGWRDGVTPWPAWVMLGTGINVSRVALQRDRIIAEERQRLERKQHRAARRA
jgi:hypothetical protein